MEKVIIYTMSTCGYCKQVKEELEKNNIEFETRLTSEWQEDWNNIISLTSLPTTPTIYYKDSYFIPIRDFNSPQHLINILKNYKKSEFSESRQVLEKVKTLNSNINIAFGRLDQLLRQIEQKIDKK
jgi:glutaredoxin|tara:strand:- start:188 stop:565 length:378 start_codon:yes stop_codon:yes gene_type:complete